MAISKSVVMPLFLEACPGFHEAWQEHRAWWGGQEPGEYNDVAAFAHYLVESVRSGRTQCFTAAFQVIERLLIEGDDDVKTLVTVGLLEDLQNIASHQSFGPDIFLPWLEPVTRSIWFQIAETWRDKQSLADVIRDELKRTTGGGSQQKEDL